jgi:hypothetical protein
MDDPRILLPDLLMPPDGACRHLPRLRMPAVVLPGTAGGTVDLGRATFSLDGALLLPPREPA